MSSSSYGGGAGLGTSSTKVYTPYGGQDGVGSMNTGSGGNVTSMGSGPATQTSSSSYLTKTVNMVSSLTTTVVDSAAAAGQAMGLNSGRKGLLGNPNAFPTNASQYPANYNPPTSMSSETFHQSSYTTSTTSIQSQSGFKSTGGPWGSAASSSGKETQKLYDKPFTGTASAKMKA